MRQLAKRFVPYHLRLTVDDRFLTAKILQLNNPWDFGSCIAQVVVRHSDVPDLKEQLIPGCLKVDNGTAAVPQEQNTSLDPRKWNPHLISFKAFKASLDAAKQVLQHAADRQIQQLYYEFPSIQAKDERVRVLIQELKDCKLSVARPVHDYHVYTYPVDP